MTVKNLTGERVVAVGKNVRFDDNRFPHYPLDWELATIDFRVHPLDDDADASLL
jgi:hypothetical protein